MEAVGPRQGRGWPRKPSGPTKATLAKTVEQPASGNGRLPRVAASRSIIPVLPNFSNCPYLDNYPASDWKSFSVDTNAVFPSRIFQFYKILFEKFIFSDFRSCCFNINVLPMTVGFFKKYKKNMLYIYIYRKV